MHYNKHVLSCRMQTDNSCKTPQDETTTKNIILCMINNDAAILPEWQAGSGEKMVIGRRSTVNQILLLLYILENHKVSDVILLHCINYGKF